MQQLPLTSTQIVRPSEPAGHHNLLRVLWALAVCVVAVGSLLPASSSPIRAINSLHISDWVEHFCAYAFLAFLPALHERPRVILLTAAGAILLGISLEFGQLLAQDRACEFSDVVADATGVGLGLAVGWSLRSVPLVRSLLSRPAR